VSDDRAATILERMTLAFAQAEAQCGDALNEATYGFAGRPVTLGVVGRILGHRTHSAFTHLRATPTLPACPSLTIELWDAGETGVGCPFDEESGDFERRWLAAGGILSSSADGRYVGFRYQASLTVLDRETQRILGCRRSGSPLSTGEYSKPLVHLLSVWYHDRNVQLLHAGLVARDGAGVLIPGESGTGKSTTCVAAAAQGLEFLADDFAGLEHSNGSGFQGHSVFGTACLRRPDLDRFPDIRGRAVDDGIPEEDKPILFLPELYPGRVRASVRMRALVLLRVGAERTEIRRASRSDALRRFAASTLHTVVPRPGRTALERLTALVEQVPAWWLSLGPELLDLAPAIARILESSSAPDEA